MKTLSISVAAYNMEKLIRQNLDSFVHSPVAEDVEVLVIDDGSKDTTAEIVREYEAQYPGVVRLIQQENAGPGSTVNRGMEHATGKYFRMVDADDWVGEDFAKYVNALKETDVDMVVTDYTCVDDKTGEREFHPAKGLPVGQELPFDSVCRGLALEMHAVTFRTEILQKNTIRVFNGFYTDIQYLLFPAPYVRTVLYVDANVYMYRVSLSGQSMAAPSLQRNIQMHDDMVFSIAALYERIKDEQPAIAAYVLAKLIYVSGTELGTWLTFAPDKEAKAKLFDYMERLRAASADAYAGFCRYKTVRMLKLFGGAFYPMISRMHRKRMGIDK